MQNISTSFKELLYKHINALELLHNFINMNSLEQFIDALSNCKGSLFFCGVGKSSIVADKISSMLRSFGFRSFVLSPINAVHGDLGVLGQDDIVIFISNSAVTAELLPIFEFCKSSLIKVGIVTRNTNLGVLQDFNYQIILPFTEESDNKIPAPTVSTTIFFVIFDIIAIYMARSKNLTTQEYSKFHPKGKLGMSLTPISKITNFLNSEYLYDIKNIQNLNLEQIFDIVSKYKIIVISDLSKVIGYLTLERLSYVLSSTKKDNNTLYNAITRNFVYADKNESIESVRTKMYNSHFSEIIILGNQAEIGYISLVDISAY